jgi:hypothetical protein
MGSGRQLKRALFAPLHVAGLLFWLLVNSDIRLAVSPAK